jgi:pimeloyl-ACP methyl ester carboxylesterase
MKTILSSGLLGCLSLALLACDSGDSLVDAPVDTVTEGSDDAARDDVPGTDIAADGVDGADAAAEAPTPSDDALPATSATPTDAEAPIDPALEAVPALQWRSCGTFDDRDLECAEVLVPLDYEQPDAEQLPIAMRRIVANPLEPYHGSLLINPGGPGVTGIDFALRSLQGGLFDRIAPGYDIIGFDPRGVGDSGERGCGIRPAELFPAAAPPPAEGLQAGVDLFAQAGARCEAEWGPLFRELGSNNVVRDMEAIRAALGEPKLNFYGGSYGTRLGSLYAHMFPATAGRIVLDASVHPRSSWTEATRASFYEIARLHEQLFLDCEEGVLACPTDSRTLFDQMLTSAGEAGFGDALIGFWRSGLEQLGGPSALVNMLQQQAVDPNGAWLQATLTGGGGPDDGGAGLVALLSVNCTDDVLDPPSIAQAESLFAEFNAVNPLYADDALDVLLCTGWPATRDPVPLPTAPDVDEPLLVIGGLNDWRTPYEQAVAMTEAIGKATLLTSNHYGHGATRLGNDCVIAHVRAYLTSGSLPATGTLCE